MMANKGGTETEEKNAELAHEARHSHGSLEDGLEMDEESSARVFK